jgi:hypothetical protein
LGNWKPGQRGEVLSAVESAFSCTVVPTAPIEIWEDHTVRKVVLAALIGFVVATHASAQCLEGMPEPREAGAFSTFLKNGLNLQTETVLPGSFLVSGVPTQVVEISGGEFDGTQIYATRGPSGVDLYGFFNPDFFIDGFGFFDRTTTFTPARHAPLTKCIGDTWGSVGVAFIEFHQDGAFVDSVATAYTEEWRMAAREAVSVPFGTFIAFKAQGSFEISNIDGEPFVQLSSRTEWVASGLGTVRSETTEDGVTDVFELVDTNRTPVPEPAAGLLALVGVLVLVSFRLVRATIADRDV